MILEQSMHPGWLSNTWLVGDQAGGHAVIVDAGGPPEPILARIDGESLTVTHVLCTHPHGDHVAHAWDYGRRFSCPVAGGARDRERYRALDLAFEGGEIVDSGELRIRILAVPGHTVGHLAFLVNESHVFTGDTLFRGSIGGTRAPGHGSFAELRQSILEVLMRLPDEVRVYPGHTEPTSIGAERSRNPFIRFWTGADPGLDVPCTAFGDPATLLVTATDYDGGTKHQVRYPDGAMEVVPGSQVTS